MQYRSRTEEFHNSLHQLLRYANLAAKGSRKGAFSMPFFAPTPIKPEYA